MYDNTLKWFRMFVEYITSIIREINTSNPTNAVENATVAMDRSHDAHDPCLVGLK